MRPSRFLLGALSGVALVLVAIGLLAAGLGRGQTAAAPQASPVAAAACATPGRAVQVPPGKAPVSAKRPLSAADQQTLDAVSTAEWAGGARTLGITTDDLSTALNAGKSVDELAAAHHTTTAQVRAAMVAAGTAQVAAMLQRAQVTQSQADTLDHTLVVAIADKVTHANQIGGTPGTTQAPAGTKLNPAKEPVPVDDQTRQAIVDAEFNAVAQAFGLSPAQFKVDLGCGSLATLPQAQDVSSQRLRDAALAAAQAALDSRVRAGSLTQAQADAVRQDFAVPLAQKLARLVVQPLSTAATPAPGAPATPQP